MLAARRLSQLKTLIPVTQVRRKLGRGPPSKYSSDPAAAIEVEGWPGGCLARPGVRRRYRPGLGSHHVGSRRLRRQRCSRCCCRPSPCRHREFLKAAAGPAPPQTDATSSSALPPAGPGAENTTAVSLPTCRGHRLRLRLARGLALGRPDHHRDHPPPRPQARLTGAASHSGSA